MSGRLRAPLAAAVALLIGGGLAARGFAGVFDVRHFLFPYLWLFLAFEAAYRRRRLGDVEAFLIGAAAGLIYDGAYTKALQDGAAFLGLDWPSTLAACFDWGMIAVVSLHVANYFVPRIEDRAVLEGIPERAALAVLSVAAVVFYSDDAWTGRSRLDLALKPGPWVDLLFVAAAAALLWRAFQRAAEELQALDRWIRALAAFCVWVPGAQLLQRLAGGWFAVVLIAAWTAALYAWLRRCWLAQGLGRQGLRSSRAIVALAAWRFVGAALLVLLFGPADNGGATAAAFSFFVDLPTRLLFASVFLGSALAV